jgi:hypothetical protein
MNTEEHDDLWELLGRAKETKASPFFSRNVLRAIREEESSKVGWFNWLRTRWGLAALGAAALAVVATVSILPEQRPDPLIALASQVSASPDYQVISNLDELLDSERNSVWLDASTN